VATRKLQPSRLLSQRELLQRDLDLAQLKLLTRGKAAYPIDEAVISGDIIRTIEGASTVEITVNDRSRAIRNSGRLVAETDIRIDGLWFRLVNVKKQGNNLSLIFESREVAILRTYKKKKTSAWGKTTRTRFAKALITEVKELSIKFVCPELTKKKVTNMAGDPDANQRDDPYEERAFGFGAQHEKRDLIINGAKASAAQLSNAEDILNEGASRLVPRKLLVCAIMTSITESSLINVPFGDRDSIGLFQQRPSQGWGTVQQILNPKYSAGKFFDSAVQVQRSNPSIDYGDLCQAVQRSAFPDRYAKHRTEAERIVTAYGVPGRDVSSPNDIASANNMTEWGQMATEYQFSRGFPKQARGGKRAWDPEDSWECLQRLADEVHWRCFEVSGSVYFISEPKLFQSAPRARIKEGDSGVDWVDWDYDVGKHNARVTVTGRIDRWAAPPGSVVELYDEGAVNGRWLVTEIRRSLFNPSATITLKKPRPKLPEPSKDDLTGLWDNPWTGETNQGEGVGGLAVGPYHPPLNTPRPSSSQFNIQDPEGAPDSSGVRWHAALDWMAPLGGQPVFAAQDGEIVEVTPSRGSFGQVFGGVVKIRNARGYVWVYRHVAPKSAREVGQQVSAGDIVAEVVTWSTNPSSSHVHIEVWKTLDGGYHKENMVDPLEYIDQIKAGKLV